MHELGITKNIVAIVAEHAQGRKVSRVRLEVGALSGVMSDAIRFCFDAVARGTCLDGAMLDVIDIEGRGRCRQCGSEFPMQSLFAHCPCGSRSIERISGEELNIREFEYSSGDALHQSPTQRLAAGT